MKVVTKPVRRTVLVGVILASLVTPPVFAQSSLTPEQLTLRVERLTELSQRSEAKLEAAQAQLKTLSDNMARMGRLIDNRAMLDMIQQVDEISEEIGLLRGEIEVQGNDINDIKKRQRELYLDIDRRLRDIESGATASTGQSGGTVAPGVTTSSAQQAPSLEPPSSQSTTATETITPPSGQSTTATETITPPSGQTTAATETPTAPVTPAVTQSEEKAAYQAAFDTLKEGRYKKAKAELMSFLDRFPESSYAGNAQYWLGEAHYVTRNFEQGIVGFLEVINRYPTSRKVPDAMLKLGYTYYELKQFDQAKAMLQDLRTRYPQATAARLASKRLDRIRKEGH